MPRLRHGTADAWVQSLACPCGICCEQIGTGTVSLRALRFHLSVKCCQRYKIIYSSIIDAKQFTESLMLNFMVRAESFFFKRLILF